jgi:hypothetical protein
MMTTTVTVDEGGTTGTLENRWSKESVARTVPGPRESFPLSQLTVNSNRQVHCIQRFRLFEQGKVQERAVASEESAITGY